MMPTVEFDKDAFEQFVGKKLSLEQLKDRISYLGTDLESIEGNTICVEIFPNRPDMLSLQGFARAFSSFIGHKTGLLEYKAKKSGHKVIVDKSVGMRPYTACAIVKNITFTDQRIKEIMQMQEKLATTHGRNRKKSAYGVYPIDNVTFPIRYTTKDPEKVMFQPLGFAKKMPAIETERTHPTGKKYKDIADSWKKQGYKNYPFFIDAKDNVMCMLPYTNSHDTGKVELGTKEVFIECTGTDFQNVHFALNIFVAMFADMGGEIYSLEIEYPDKTITTPDLSPKEMELDVLGINTLLGLELSEKEAKTLLERMGFGHKGKKVLIPPYRADILHQVDLAEDISIAYGFENFKETIPKVATIARESRKEVLKGKIADALVGLGMQEASTYHLSSEDHQTTKMNSKAAPIMLANAISLDYNALRSQLLPSLVDVLSRNTRHEYPQKIFTLGNVFLKDPKEDTGVGEKSMLAIALSSEQAAYTDIRQVVEYLLRAFGFSQWKIKEHEHPSFISGRCASILFEEEQIAVCGEISPLVLKNWGLEMPVCAAEIDVDLLFRIVSERE